MKKYIRGEGEPEITIVGSVHGDEPAGRDAIENFLEEDYEFRRSVKFIIANEEALDEDVRYIDTDLNRSFPGDSQSKNHEDRLASKLADEVEGTVVLDIHTTRSYAEPFATFTHLNKKTRSLMQDTNVDYAVHFPEESGTLHAHVTGVVVETGIQGTVKARENAEEVIKNFLARRNVIEGESQASDPEIFEYYETVEGDWNFKAENFRKVNQGEVFAEKDGEKLEASEDFYPVLMSTEGYNGMLGFKARK